MAGEKNFENKIKKFLKDRGCWYVKYFANRNTRAGVPDILACVNGCFVAIEVKAENGKPSELQKWNVEQIQKSQGYAVILYPNQYNDFAAMIDAIMHVNSRTAVALEDKINSRGGD